MIMNITDKKEGVMTPFFIYTKGFGDEILKK